MCLSSSIFTFLYPIDGFWSKIKYNIKRHPFDSSCNLRSQIVKVCSQVILADDQGWIRHSALFFNSCLWEKKLFSI